jgi:hypothetical protein
VIAGKLAAPHPRAVVDERHRRHRRIGGDRDDVRSRVQRVGDDLGEDRLLRRPGIRITQVLDEVQQIDAGLAQLRLLAGILTGLDFAVTAHV